jgi:predicted nucleic acid-binding protein
MKVVDSSGWLEFFTNGPLANDYAVHLATPDEVLTPTIVVYEIYKTIRRRGSVEEALVAVHLLEQTRIVPVSPMLALAAADFSIQHRLAMADAIVYATARVHFVQLWTSDSDFDGLPEVVYLKKN